MTMASRSYERCQAAQVARRSAAVLQVVEELMQLFEGIEVWDAFRKQRFVLRALAHCWCLDGRGSTDLTLQRGAGERAGLPLYELHL